MKQWGEKLGKWALIDIETSGVNPEEDSIIDVGFLQFEGTKLVKKYSSLVRFPSKKAFMNHPQNFLTSSKSLRVLRRQTSSGLLFGVRSA